MLPDQRVGFCSCTCRESTRRPMRATTIFFAVCILAHWQEPSLQDALPCKKSFLLPHAVFFQIVCHKKWSFMICMTTCSLIHLFMLMSMQSVIHIHTHTHIDETHNAPHTAHTNLHDICNCTACINNRHRQAHIDHDIQSTFHILPHIHNMCTQLITPCDTQQYVCNHIIVVCMLLKHSLVLFAHQLCFSSSTSQPQHVYNMLCC